MWTSLLLVPGMLVAAATGSIRGRAVLGVDKTPASEARIEIWHAGLRTIADRDGRFRLTNVPVGAHDVWIVQPGHRTERIVKTTVNPGKTTNLGDVGIDSTWIELRTGTKTKATSKDLAATIRPARNFRVGDKPEFAVSIRNLSSSPVLLVRAADMSGEGGSPRVTIDVDGPPGSPPPEPRIAMCGFGIQGVTPDHFVEVAAGTSFDPCTEVRTSENLRAHKFMVPGRYVATFHYATTNGDANSWIRCFGPQPCDREWFLALIPRVPAAELTATTTFEVKP